MLLIQVKVSAAMTSDISCAAQEPSSKKIPHIFLFAEEIPISDLYKGTVSWQEVHK